MKTQTWIDEYNMEKEMLRLEALHILRELVECKRMKSCPERREEYQARRTAAWKVAYRIADTYEEKIK